MAIGLRKLGGDAPASDGYRILVERKWPTGLTRDDARVDLWLKDIAPSEGSEAWYSGKPERWGEFECGYFAELDGKFELVRQILDRARKGNVTLLYISGDEARNNAAAIRDYIEAKKDELTAKEAA